MRDAAWIKSRNHGLQFVALWEESRLFQAKIKNIDLVHGSVVLERMTTDLPQNGIQLEGESDGRNNSPYI
jgi:predicted RNA-binding protein